jgi:hypothetical protein
LHNIKRNFLVIERNFIEPWFNNSDVENIEEKTYIKKGAKEKKYNEYARVSTLKC